VHLWKTYTNNKTCSSQAFLVGGDVPVKRIISSLWQMGAGWGPAVDNTAAVDAMLEMHVRGSTTFDGLLELNQFVTSLTPSTNSQLVSSSQVQITTAREKVQK
jgi:hypothetical protein